jgi:hypothetical protein
MLNVQQNAAEAEVLEALRDDAVEAEVPRNAALEAPRDNAVEVEVPRDEA